MNYGDSGSGYMNTSFDGSNKTSTGYAKVNLETAMVIDKKIIF